MNKLFVYGIFLNKFNRDNYGMYNPEYAVVEGYATYHLGRSIVEARPCEGAALTGLLVDVYPYITGYRNKLVSNWDKIDALEHNYEKIVITTTDKQKAYMYVGKACTIGAGKEILGENQGREYSGSRQASQELAV